MAMARLNKKQKLVSNQLHRFYVADVGETLVNSLNPSTRAYILTKHANIRPLINNISLTCLSLAKSYTLAIKK